MNPFPPSPPPESCPHRVTVAPPAPALRQCPSRLACGILIAQIDRVLPAVPEDVVRIPTRHSRLALVAALGVAILVPTDLRRPAAQFRTPGSGGVRRVFPALLPALLLPPVLPALLLRPVLGHGLRLVQPRSITASTASTRIPIRTTTVPGPTTSRARRGSRSRRATPRSSSTDTSSASSTSSTATCSACTSSRGSTSCSSISTATRRSRRRCCWCAAER